MPAPTDKHLALLKDVLSTFRTQFVEGISEYALITALQAKPYLIFEEDALREPLVLFQTHFVMFHCLYQLRDEWREQNEGELEIGLTQITLKPMLASLANLQLQDPLADYYLDWRNFSATDKDEVDELLNSFWKKMAGLDTKSHISEWELNSACRIMEIESLAHINVVQLKQQYRRLQHINHPDKGGSIESAQAILQAYTQLRRYLISIA